MVATSQIGRKLARKRDHKHTELAPQVSTPLPSAAPLSQAEFRAALASLAEGSENRPIPSAEVFSREHLYADHD